MGTQQFYLQSIITEEIDMAGVIELENIGGLTLVHE
jgi:hypothetical protein